MKKILLLPFLLLTIVTAKAQLNLPELYSYEIVDTVCQDGNLKHFLNITVKDIDADSTYLSSYGFDLGFIDNGSLVVESPPYVPGDTLRTFKMYGYTNWSVSTPGLNQDNLVFEMADELNDTTTVFNYDIGPVALYGPIDVILDLSSITFCSTDNPVDISSYASPMGGTFTWGLNNPITTDGLFDIQSWLSEANDGIEYYYENSAGCGNYYLEYPNIVDAPTTSMSVSNSTCGNADGSATVSITGQYSPFTVNWTTGFQDAAVSTSSTVNNLSSGTYYATVVDANGCQAQATAQISDTDLSLTPTITSPTCPGGVDGAIDLAISSSGTVTEVFWSNAQFGTNISNLAAGEYTVSVVTDNNCKATETYYVTDPAGLAISVDNVGYVDCSAQDPLLNSDIQITTTGGSGSYTWQWSSGQTTEDIFGLQAGTYQCTVTDVNTGCTLSWGEQIFDWSGPYVSVNDVTTPQCGQNNGEIDISVFPATSGAQIVSYSWSNGANTEDLTNIDAGSYTIIVEDANGCTGNANIDLPYKKPYQPTICLLTVDTSYTYNQVVWEKDPSQNIEGFNVYRETQTQGQFELVSQRPYTLESFFMDNAASPMDRSWRYYITTYDACGNESLPSFIHKTIHVASSTSNGTDYTVSWDDYEGISYTGVDVFRFDNVNGWNLIAANQSGNSFVDTPTETAGLDYMVSFILTNSCTSTKATDYNSSRSNTTSSIFNPGESTTSISTEESNQILAYPNPAEDHITLFIEQWQKFNTVTLRDAQGKVILRKTVQGQYTALSLSDFARGIYFIELTDGEEIYREKIIKQ